MCDGQNGWISRLLSKIINPCFITCRPAGNKTKKLSQSDRKRISQTGTSSVCEPVPPDLSKDANPIKEKSMVAPGSPWLVKLQLFTVGLFLFHSFLWSRNVNSWPEFTTCLFWAQRVSDPRNYISYAFANV